MWHLITALIMLTGRFSTVCEVVAAWGEPGANSSWHLITALTKLITRPRGSSSRPLITALPMLIRSVSMGIAVIKIRIIASPRMYPTGVVTIAIHVQLRGREGKPIDCEHSRAVLE